MEGGILYFSLQRRLSIRLRLNLRALSLLHWEMNVINLINLEWRLEGIPEMSNGGYLPFSSTMIYSSCSHQPPN